QYMEFGTTNIIRGLREVTKRWLKPVRVTFAHPRNARIKEFEQFFGCPVEFGRRTNLIELSQTDLSVPIINADKGLLDILRSHCTEVLAKHRERQPSLIETVERPIVDRLSNAEARLDIVAKELGMSSRSLSRALAKLGTSFHAVVETLRKDLALKYLEQSDLNLKEITFLLGYADISGFNHAFKRWTGKTPSDVRFRKKRRSRGTLGRSPLFDLKRTLRSRNPRNGLWIAHDYEKLARRSNVLKAAAAVRPLDLQLSGLLSVFVE